MTPVRAARRAAESMASGNLDDRMQVRGQDDIARMATSMNYMAAELQKQINSWRICPPSSSGSSPTSRTSCVRH